ncbi:methyltransferase domain-containing protein [Peribacillus simplex]|jgi:ubiquinone/menaquinone biosynthesis C-methylase UbiE|uniref:class I SAM-dependent DNA methyltransferase n=1 Tax=Peribacillus TaxID=2675229 RepID=UPI0006ABF880|nr:MULTISPECIES: class I SAM-dependent methyltransferase [Peribacillus]KOR79741.1 methyltransferase [Bacillus sp. FJAT-21352]MBX9954061.1 methyltransferase domain-containing protein [Peribacillus simplex]MCK2003020.1 methyltransferase domain-containing protein [Peribacillus frigoritolerans]MED4689221.1 methyltransferase domain-containing protein [Peribacillus frigoritolerans]UZD45414.1 methyltransferase domain-containing protein [Peribacillus frigoritolerans]
MTYERFAYVYDELMKDAPYEKWLMILTAKLEQYGIGGRKVLDLACGTGEMTVELAQHGFEVTGVDLSDEMLLVANEKAVKLGLSIPLFQQNMAELEGLGQFDCVTIFCDSLNYLRDEEDIVKTFSRVHEHLKDGGLFMFDIHSVYKMEEIFRDHTFAVNGEEVSYIWDCFPGEEPYSVEHDLSFFVRDDESGLYDRFDELHYQRTYPVEQYKKWLEQAGFTVSEILADLEEAPLVTETERILFVASK